MMMIPKSNFDLFDDIFGDQFFKRNETKLMKTDIKEADDKYIIDVDLPGYNKEDIKIDVTDGNLTINAKTSSDNKEEKLMPYTHGTPQIINKRYNFNLNNFFF